MKNLFLLILIVALGWHVEAATYYVATNGNNLNPGTLISPWRTAQKAGTTAVAGDKVFFGAGTWDERVTVVNNSVTFKGANNASVIRGFDLTGRTNCMILAMKFTKPQVTGYIYDEVYLEDAHYNQIIDCVFSQVYPNHAVVSSAVSGAHWSNNNLIRGNTVYRAGIIPGFANDGNVAFMLCGTNNIIEYNDVSQSDDFCRVVGYQNVVRNNYFHDIEASYFSSALHVDFLQTFDAFPTSAELGFRRTLVENNFVDGNNMADSHFFIAQNEGSNDILTNNILRRNVVMRQGSYMVLNDSHRSMYGYNNDLISGQQQSPSGYTIEWSTRATLLSTNFNWINGLFHTANNNSGGVVFEFGDATTTNSARLDGTLAYLSGTPRFPWSVGDVVGSDPLLVSFPGNPRLQSVSLARAAGVAMTTAVGAGVSSAALTVADANWFVDGFSGLVAKDRIKIGSGAVVDIGSINYANGVITLAAARTWSSGDGVWLEGTTDIGALPFASVELTAATIANVGTTYTVTPVGDARGVWFYVDGIPTTWVSTAPYSATIASGVVTAKAYALYAQNTPVVTATATGPSNPTISAIANQSIPQDTSTTALAFTVGDSVDPAISLTVTATSSNHTLADDADCALGGSGANRTVTITPNGGQTGVTTITLVVTNLSLLTATNTFTLTVTTPSIKVGGNVKKKGRFSVR